MRCIYRGWQSQTRTHVELCLTAFAPHFPRKKNKNKTKERKFLTSSSLYCFPLLFIYFLNESLCQLKPTFLYLILFISIIRFAANCTKNERQMRITILSLHTISHHTSNGSLSYLFLILCCNFSLPLKIKKRGFFVYAYVTYRCESGLL